jgi:hypothetical protein
MFLIAFLWTIAGLVLIGGIIVTYVNRKDLFSKA